MIPGFFSRMGQAYVEPATNGNGTNGTHMNGTESSNGSTTQNEAGLTVLITFTTASICFKTSKTALQNLFPPGRSGYKFTTPGTIAYASFFQTTLNKM
ncbi:hypothetical protein AC578_2000 [Pseudocercospora eumusae]|uniref:Uncharacterized protein n=1 Tax=Pseudocercospora eumusae TaxID=321146 RepID=A0A139HHC7_9PEZI|nr:hypothetical protein AC578_2000 [Pseudocercospora eumusae]